MKKIILFIWLFISVFFVIADNSDDCIDKPKLLLVVYNNNLDARFIIHLNDTCLMNQVISSYGYGSRDFNYTPIYNEVNFSISHTFFGETRKWNANRKLSGKKFALVICRVLYSLVDAKWLANVITYESDNYDDLYLTIIDYEENYRLMQ